MQSRLGVRTTLLVSLLMVSGFAGAAEATRSLDSLLGEMRTQGVKLIYSSALVTPEMKVEADLSGATAKDRLVNILRPHGLSPIPGPDGSLLVVKTPPPSGPTGVVSHIKVLSDKIEDVSSLEAWRAS